MRFPIMNARMRIARNAELKRQTRAKAKGGVFATFNLVAEGSSTNIARDKDKLIGKAFWQDHLRATVSKRPATRKKRR